MVRAAFRKSPGSRPPQSVPANALFNRPSLMALVLPHSIFLHVPKTGGTWVRTAIDRAGIPNRESNRGQEPLGFRFHTDLTNTTDRGPLNLTFRRRPGTWYIPGGRFCFAFVRNPLDWYRSYWAHRMRKGWKPRHKIDSVCASDEFETFVGHMLEKFPGYVSELYELYTGPEADEIGFVGRQENLVPDLIRALRDAGEPFDEGRIRETGPVNLGSELQAWSEKSRYSPQLEEAVRRAEHRAMKRFGYL